MKPFIFLSLTAVIVLNAWLWHSNGSIANEVESLQALAQPPVGESILRTHQVSPSNIDHLKQALNDGPIDAAQAGRLLDEIAGLSENERAVQEEAILMKLTDANPQRAAEIALERGVTSALHFALRTWGERDSDAALAWFEEMDAQGKFVGPGAIDPLHETESALLEGISLNNFGKALAVMKMKDRTHGFHRIAIAYADQGRLLEMKDRLNDLEDGPIRQEGMQALATVMALAGKADAIAVLERNFSESERAHFAGLAMRSVPFHLMDDPGRVATWLNKNSANAEKRDTMVGFVSKWTQHDFNGVSTWLNEQQDQPWYDEAVVEFVKHAIPADPQSSIDWAVTISDQALRHQVLSEAIEQSPEASDYLKSQGIELGP